MFLVGYIVTLCIILLAMLRFYGVPKVKGLSFKRKKKINVYLNYNVVLNVFFNLCLMF